MAKNVICVCYVCVDLVVSSCCYCSFCLRISAALFFGDNSSSLRTRSNGLLARNQIYWISFFFAPFVGVRVFESNAHALLVLHWINLKRRRSKKRNTIPPHYCLEVWKVINFISTTAFFSTLEPVGFNQQEQKTNCRAVHMWKTVWWWCFGFSLPCQFRFPRVFHRLTHGDGVMRGWHNREKVKNCLLQFVTFSACVCKWFRTPKQIERTISLVRGLACRQVRFMRVILWTK